MEIFLILVGALIAAGVGYAEGCMFDNNKVGARFNPTLWAWLGFFFGFQGLLVGAVYGLIKILLHSKR